MTQNVAQSREVKHVVTINMLYGYVNGNNTTIMLGGDM